MFIKYRRFFINRLCFFKYYSYVSNFVKGYVDLFVLVFTWFYKNESILNDYVRGRYSV